MGGTGRSAVHSRRDREISFAVQPRHCYSFGGHNQERGHEDLQGEESLHRRPTAQCRQQDKTSLTLDCWTSPNAKAFMGITAHYIDDDWKPQSLVLAFVHLDSQHAGEDLCEALVAACEQFNILPELLGITTDNAANIDKLLACFEQACLDRGVTFDKKEQHVRCAAHVINLAVQALLRELGTVPSSAESSVDNDTATQAGKVP
jgi:hypothetical protein